MENCWFCQISGAEANSRGQGGTWGHVLWVIMTQCIRKSICNSPFTPAFGLQQIINEPKHIVGDSSSCNDSIFTTQLNLVMKSRVHSSLQPNCHHQIIYAKFNLKIHYPCPPPYEREIYYHDKANVDHIRKSIDEFSWERCFANTSVNNKVYMFNKAIKKIMSDYIPRETIICDDGDPP